MGHHMKHLNSHAGLRPGELKQRFLKKKYAPCKEDVSWDERGDIVDDSDRCDGCEALHCHGCFDYGYDYDGDPEDYLFYKIKEYFQNISGETSFKIKVQSAENDYPASNAKSFQFQKIDSKEDLIPELLNIMTGCGFSLFSSYDEVEDLIANLPTITTLQAKIFKKYLDDYSDYAELIALICLCKSFWIRSIESWEVQKDQYQSSSLVISSLVIHLFAKYPIPKFISNTIASHNWGLKDSLVGLVWSILWGQGISLRKTFRKNGFEMSKNFVKHLHSLVNEDDLELKEALLKAEILHLGGKEEDFQKIKNHGYFTYDIECGIDSFSTELIRWLISHRDEIADDSFKSILNWAIHEHTENTAFSLKHYSVTRAHTNAVEYKRIRNLPYSQQKWEKHGWDWSYTDYRDKHWQITELTTGKELFKEGKKMHHCVSGYSSSCALGTCAIFSLKKNNVALLTVELNPKTKIIRQAHGSCNRNATADEKTILNYWLKDIK